MLNRLTQCFQLQNEIFRAIALTCSVTMKIFFRETAFQASILLTEAELCQPSPQTKKVILLQCYCKPRGNIHFVICWNRLGRMRKAKADECKVMFWEKCKVQTKCRAVKTFCMSIVEIKFLSVSSLGGYIFYIPNANQTK